MSFYRVSWTEEMVAIVEADSRGQAIKAAMELSRREYDQFGLVDLEVEEVSNET